MRLVVFGAGGHGRELMDIAILNSRAGHAIEPVAYVVDAGVNAPKDVDGMPVHRGLDAFRGDERIVFMVGLGAPALRRRASQRIEAVFGPRFATLVHPSSQIGSRVKLGSGAAVCAGAILTTDIVVGSHAHVNTGAAVTHDCILEPYSSVNVQATLSGNCYIGEGADIGTGAKFAPRVNVGAWAVIGTGAVVLRGVPANAVAVGIPANVIKERPIGWHDLS